MCSGNKHIIKEHHKEVNKASDYAKEVGRALEHIQWEIENINCNAKIEYSNDKPNPSKEFHQQPEIELIRRCDQRSKEKCMNLKHQNINEK